MSVLRFLHDQISLFVFDAMVNLSVQMSNCQRLVDFFASSVRPDQWPDD